MEEITTTNERPTFLTVLRILTFIGSGWGIVDAIIDYSNADNAAAASELVEDAMDDAMDDIEDSEMSDSQKELMEGMMEGVSSSMTETNIKKSSLVAIISCLLTLEGAFLMWNLKKNGFYLYILGTIISVVGMIVIFDGIVGAAAAGFTGFVGVLFIVLYGVNTKHMA